MRFGEHAREHDGPPKKIRCLMVLLQMFRQEGALAQAILDMTCSRLEYDPATAKAFLAHVARTLESRGRLSVALRGMRRCVLTRSDLPMLKYYVSME